MPPAGRTAPATVYKCALVNKGLMAYPRILAGLQLSLIHISAAIAAVDDEKHLLHSIFGTALYTQIVNDKQVIFVKAGNKL